MQKLIFALVLIVSFVAQAKSGDFVFPAYNCSQGEQECFNAVDYAIAAKYSGFPADDVPTLYSQGKKTEYVFVMAPGLWSNSAQYKSIIQLFVNTYKQNVLALVLPGHGADKDNINSVSYTSWLLSHKNALTSAAYLGRKTVLVGQSMGGLLSVRAALDAPKNLAGMILFEPALELREVIELAVCHGSGIRDQLSKVEGAEEILKMFPPNMDSGCQVVKLAKELRSTFSTTLIPLKSTIWKNLARQVHVPIFLFNHPKDNVTSASINKTFAKAMGAEVYYNELDVSKHLKKLPPPKTREEVIKRAVLNVFLGDARLSRLHGDALSIDESIQTPAFKAFVKQELKLNP